MWHVGTLQAAQTPLAHEDEVMAASFSPDGRTLLTGCADHTARLWDVASGRPLGEPMRNHGGLHVVAFSPDATRIAWAGEGLAIVDVATGALDDRGLTKTALATAVTFCTNDPVRIPT